jgi:hypothetical protein
MARTRGSAMYFPFPTKDRPALRMRAVGEFGGRNFAALLGQHGRWRLEGPMKGRFPGVSSAGMNSPLVARDALAPPGVDDRPRALGPPCELGPDHPGLGDRLAELQGRLQVRPNGGRLLGEAHIGPLGRIGDAFGPGNCFNAAVARFVRPPLQARGPRLRDETIGSISLSDDFVRPAPADLVTRPRPVVF